jgi:hypothetical protein
MSLSANSEIRKTSAPGLLELLQLRLNCIYLSDLHFVCPAALTKAVRAIPEDDFSPEEWADAEQYLSRQNHAFGDGRTARDSLLAFLKGTAERSSGM